MASLLEPHRRPLAVTHSLAAVAPQVGADPTKVIVLVRDRGLDQGGWNRSRRLALPAALPAHRHRVPWPASTPELHPAERLWAVSNPPLGTVGPEDLGDLEELEELDTLHLDRCAALQTHPALVATIPSATHSRWWPADSSPRT